MEGCMMAMAERRSFMRCSSFVGRRAERRTGAFAKISSDSLYLDSVIDLKRKREERRTIGVSENFRATKVDCL